MKEKRKDWVCKFCKLSSFKSQPENVNIYILLHKISKERKEGNGEKKKKDKINK